MKLAGGGAAVAASGPVGAEAAFDDVRTERVVDLGEEGLSEGDVIDPYLDEYFVDDTEIHVPAGEYDWEGRGFDHGATRNAAVIGQGEVVLHTVGNEYRNTIVAEEGTVAVANLTVRGIVDGAQNRLEAHEGARIVVDNWNFPDGSEPASRSRGFYTRQEHAGEIEFRNCYVRNFSDNGFQVASQGNGAGGRVVIDNCVSHNNNIAGFCIGGNGSVIRNSLVLNDDAAPVDTDDARNMRGIRLDYGDESQDVRIEDTDVVHTYDGPGSGGPVRWSSAAASGSGHIERVRIHNDTATAAIAARRSRAENWTGTDISVVGDGDLDVPDWFTNVRQTAERTAAGADTSTGSDDDPGARPADGYGRLPHRVIVDGTLTGTVTSYELRFSGDVELDDAISSEGPSSWDLTDDVVDDGTVVGVVGYGVDGFRYAGELMDVSVDGVVDITVDSSDL